MRNTRNAVIVAFLFLYTVTVPGWAGSLVTWGYDEDGLSSDTPVGGDFSAVSAGGYHNVACNSRTGKAPHFRSAKIQLPIQQLDDQKNTVD